MKWRHMDTDLLDTLSLYLHIPFCQAKCHYCDFNSYAGMLGLREQYVEALRAEIVLAGARVPLDAGSRRRCRTIFFGGGTPSLLEAEQVQVLLQAAREAFDLDADAEITLEANPGALEYSRLDKLRGLGVNRLSMGAQSFDADLLRWMGRIHSPLEIESAVAAGRAAGFTNINLDFIYALPGQSLQTWSETLDRALMLAPEHLSLYSLIVEEGTPLFKWVRQGHVTPADEDIAADMYEMAEERLATAGYIHYEISNWAKPGHECQHNLTYWHNLPYIGLGAGAHGWFDGHRYSEVRPIRGYIGRVCDTVNATTTADSVWRALPGAAVTEDEAIPRALEMAETAMLGLRLLDGIDLGAFAQRYGVDFDTVFGGRLAPLHDYDLMQVRDGFLRLTSRGLLLGNEVFERLLPDRDETPAGA
jgi:oxygen-independent coproporphyrinogen III oxidase